MSQYAGQMRVGVASRTRSVVGTVTTIDAVDPSGKGVTTLDYGAGISFPSGKEFCMRNTDPANLAVAVFFFKHAS